MDGVAGCETQKEKFGRLYNNSMSGHIPVTLTNIQSLQVLDLSNNNLTGDIPVNGSFSLFTLLRLTSNPKLITFQPALFCFTDTCDIDSSPLWHAFPNVICNLIKQPPNFLETGQRRDASDFDRSTPAAYLSSNRPNSDNVLHLCFCLADSAVWLLSPPQACCQCRRYVSVCY
ncbi:hypothetical protein DVH24_016472 [Malus domestica]|uniref:Leucine-rich repeat-containing N-terminal plant-type domain-containing protein n=1 Tax=Malus domestica TaxID=3750 RepID=A0A498HSD0_MALDO|nr:hypothetical protein DVH24_016472 [Malus domestica]